MFEKLEQLRKLSDETKRWIALGGATGISGIIFAFWVVSLSVTLNSSQNAVATNAGSNEAGAVTAPSGVSPLSALEANISAAVAPLGSLVHNFSSYFSSTSPATTSPIIAMASTPSADSSIDSAVVLGGLPASSLAAPGNAGNVTSDPSTSAGASLTPLSIDHLLIPGDTGPQVVLLQKALAGQGFYNGPLNGKLGPATDAALVRFQVAYNIVAANARGSGQVGPKTRAVINQLLGQ